jgi:hypothetical protein
MKYRLIYRKEEKFVFVLNFVNKECLRQEPNTEPRSRSDQKCCSNRTFLYVRDILSHHAKSF